MPRVVRCTIEMEMIEGEHFAFQGTDENAKEAACDSFIDTINQIDNAGDLLDYVQCKIVEDIS